MKETAELTPGQRLLLQLVSARAANYVDYWQARQRLRHERLLNFVELAEVQDGVELASLLNRAASDEKLGDVIDAIVEQVVRESSREKIAALGRLIRVMQDADPEPDVDEAWLLLRAVADLDPPHVRILRRLRDEGSRYQGLPDYELARMFQNGTVVMYPMLKMLEHHGLAGPLTQAEAGDPDAAVEWAIWDFGIFLLETLLSDKPHGELPS